MTTNYRKHQQTLSFIQYHFVFCPRYRRKIFDETSVEERFQSLVREVCQSLEIEVLSVSCGRDYAHLWLNVPPVLSPAEVMKFIKRQTGQSLRAEFEQLSKMPNLWTRSYFVSTEDYVESSVISSYVSDQKTRFN